MYRYKKHFTLDEARSYLPQLKYDMTNMITLKEKLDKIGFNIYTHKYRPGFHPDTLTEYPDEFIQLVEVVQALQEDGIFIKGIAEGLADFPAIRSNGDEVFLCWKEGEDDIYFWHTLDGGYRGRQSIEEF
jgi:hypothetical protein